MRTLRLVPALLLVLSGCVVNTDELKPKTQADCAYAPGLKPCGNKCMRTDDPATGCANAGCNACPGVPSGWESYCDPALLCASRPPCPEGWAYCDGPYDGVCDDLLSDGSHCGACGRSCQGDACSLGECPTPIVYASLTSGGTGNAWDLAYDGFSVYWVIDNYLSPWNGALVADGVVQAEWSGRPWRLVADADGIVVASMDASDAIWDVTGPTVTPLTYPAAEVMSLSADPSYAYYSTFGSTALQAVGRYSGSNWSYDLGAVLTATAPVDPVYGGDDILAATAAGTLEWVDYGFGADGTYATGLEPPAALTVFTGAVGSAGTPRRIAFWITTGGRVFRRELPAGPIIPVMGWDDSSTITFNYVDIAADADGVYWTDYHHYAVVEWRAAREDVVLLASPLSDPPVAVAPATLGVLWLSGFGNVHATAK